MDDPGQNEPIEAAPAEALGQLLDDAGDDVKKLFGLALSMFAGPYAGTTTYADKKKALDQLIRKG